MAKQSNKKHYAWIILAACCLFQGGTAGVVGNCGGIFYNPVCQDLGLEVSAFTLYLMFYGLAGFLALPYTSRLLRLLPPRAALFLMGLAYCGCTCGMGAMTSLTGFYVIGALQGVCGSLFLYYISPLLINNWFEGAYGLAMGVYGAFSGLSGVFFNPILTAVIQSRGWRTGYLVQGLLSFAFVLPAALLVRALEPEKLGLAPYGAGSTEAGEKSSSDTSPVTKADRTMLLFALLFTMCSAITAAYSQHFAKYASTIGLTPAIGALLVSSAMVGNILGKFTQGLLRDRIGTRGTLCIFGAVVGLCNLLILIPRAVVLYPAAAGCGLSMSLGTLGIPMLVKHLYGTRRYQRFYIKCSSFMSLMSAMSITVVSLLYEIRYSYTPVFIIGAGLGFLGVLSVLLADRVKRKTESIEQAQRLK